MTQTLGSNVRVRWDRSKDRLSRKAFEADVERILALVVEVRHAWDDAVDGGVWAPRTDFNGPGSGIAQSRPTESAVASPTRRQLRGKARHAALLVAEARATLEEAGVVLANGLLQTDPEEWIEATEKRQAATQRRD